MLFKDIYKLTQPGNDWGPVLDKPTSPQTSNTESNVINNDSNKIVDQIGENNNVNVNVNLAFEMCERI